jgi:hypothetical protein
MAEWWEERTLQEKVALVILFVLLGIGALFLFGFIVMHLWNWLMPDIFGLPEVTYWQAWGLLLLSCILFKDFGSGSNDDKRSERKRKRKLREYMDEDIDVADPRSAGAGPSGEGDAGDGGAGDERAEEKE